MIQIEINWSQEWLTTQISNIYFVSFVCILYERSQPTVTVVLFSCAMRADTSAEQFTARARYLTKCIRISLTLEENLKNIFCYIDSKVRKLILAILSLFIAEKRRDQRFFTMRSGAYKFSFQTHPQTSLRNFRKIAEKVYSKRNLGNSCTKIF